MERRYFLTLSVLTFAGLSIPFPGCSTADPQLDKKLSVPDSLLQVFDQKTMNDVGKAYGSAYPDDYTSYKIEQQLKKTIGQDISGNTPEKEINDALGKSVQNDFENNNTIQLNGWVLSLTEARQCALFSLINKNH